MKGNLEIRYGKKRSEELIKKRNSCSLFNDFFFLQYFNLASKFWRIILLKDRLSVGVHIVIVVKGRFAFVSASITICDSVTGAENSVKSLFTKTV